MTEQMIAGILMLGMAAIALLIALASFRKGLFAGVCFMGLSLMFLSFGLSYTMQLAWLMEMGCVCMVLTLLWALFVGIGVRFITHELPQKSETLITRREKNKVAMAYVAIASHHAR